MLHLPPPGYFSLGGPNITSPFDTVVTVVAHAGRQRTEDTKRPLALVLRAGREADLLPKGGGSTRTAIVERAFRSPPSPELGVEGQAGFQGWG